VVVSPWRSAKWRFIWNIGRRIEENEDDILSKEQQPRWSSPYADDDEIRKQQLQLDGKRWGASGARMVLPMDVLVTSERINASDDGNDNHNKQAPHSPPDPVFWGRNRLQILREPTYINEKGQQTVHFQNNNDGGPAPPSWKLVTTRQFSSSSSYSKGDASQLRIHFGAIATLARRNDVWIRPGECVFGITNAWRASEYEMAIQRMKSIEHAYRSAQAILEQTISHETGDRRLDGTNLVDTALASIDMVRLVQARDRARFEYQKALQKWPSSSSCNSRISKPGHWPGSDEPIWIAQGTLAIRRKKPLLWGGGEEFRVIGTFTAQPLEEETEQDDPDYDDDEFYYEDDDAYEEEDDDHDSLVVEEEEK
jgi:hypothetical protein